MFSAINQRVTEDLEEEEEAFLDAYADWEDERNESEDPTAELKDFIDNFVKTIRPEDDNFQIFIIDNELYRSEPLYLLPPLRPDTELFKRWQSVAAPIQNELKSDDPKIGSIMYIASPILLDGEQKGVFIAAHSAAGERTEALAGVYLFAQMMGVGALIALFLAWLATGRLLAPITDLTRTAMAISDSDLTQRLPAQKTDGELAALTNTFNAMMDRIQSSFDSQRSFIDDAGHELRTPITIIQGHLELLDDDPQDRRETIELVMDELDRMGRLVNDMLLLAKLERPNFLQLEVIEMYPFLQEVFAKATALAERHWVLNAQESIEAPVRMVGDRQKLTGALLNLLRNATQYTQPSDTIELGYRVENSAKGPRIQLWVRDTGEGISRADQSRIFARFSRGSQPRRSEGAGLGLAIVSAIVAAHGGRVGVVSEPKRGSTFQMWVPMDLPELSSVPIPAAS
ncbi:HAMP domain-containing sensor histidine kinase [Leptothoe sp. PORK10 BA2]|uniref:HAMP domain-containing sensor histidine kinase n=1 Tax=Leptothoe sp. PORK10 BA2 TaxID=3110254 RepID=UPI002B1F5037|nr:HAMP domain-containing sensor histidine kinase [Leptothoe sp. PORK10 BA2]MEA5466832.1 HAMP domain-containing sensor histidine kinase [Leptothoe sp. PORK10 BA2]